jgi:hypothetical protein
LQARDVLQQLLHFAFNADTFGVRVGGGRSEGQQRGQ